MEHAKILGIDVGGTGIKGAPVDLETGELAAERHRIPTPQPATPQAVTETIAQLARHFDWQGPIGCGFPAAMRNGVVLTASNIHKSWIGHNAENLFCRATHCPVKVVNDADAAAMAEVHYGAGKGHGGVALMITIGTGIGTAFFTDGHLVPNTELGHIYLKGHKQVAEKYASSAAKDRDGLSWKDWALRFNEYLNYLYPLFYPDLIILGGGASKKFHKYEQFLDVPTQVVPAELLNEAGIIGAAFAARKLVGQAVEK